MSHCIYLYLGMSGYIFLILYFFGLKISFTLTNSVDTDKMPHYAAFHLGLHVLLKCTFRGVPYTKG